MADDAALDTALDPAHGAVIDPVQSAPARQPDPTAPAHARSGLRHWSAVAAACAAVVAGALAASPAAGQVRASAPAAPKALPAAQAPDPAKAALPLDCGPFPVKVAISFAADLGDGIPSTVVAAHCEAGNGTASDGVFVLTAGPGGAPVVHDTLVRWQENLTVTRLALRADGRLTATAQGYSTQDVPRCCPDLAVDLNWTRAGASYTRTQSSAPSAKA